MTLSVHGLEAGYGPAQVLFGVSFMIGPGEILALMGMLRPWRGDVTFDGAPIGGLPPHRIARAGIGLVPEGRIVFPTLSVEENLLVASRPGRWTRERVFALLPRLAERRRQRAWQLSGGEQQMLAIGRALMTNSRLLILDEATEGLAPFLRAEVFGLIAALKQEGEAALVIDKHLADLGKVADRIAILEKGRVVWQGTPAVLAADPAAVERHLHV